MKENTLEKIEDFKAVKILDDIVVNQIAAGEVVERPVSVVKELIENSIDAQASEITVSIANGGQSLIQVIDNGQGMDKGNALLAIQRFGTSKITSVTDLLNIATHGFRGEALPSIASVSKFKISTSKKSTANSSKGVQIIIEGGVTKSVIEGSFPQGTKIEVNSLFYNVPARKKFLRSENTEANLIKSLIIDFSLAYPRIKWKLIKDGQEAFSYHSKSDLFKRAKELKLGGDNPIICQDEQVIATGNYLINAYLCSPIDAVSNAGTLRILVNRRIVRDKLLLKAIRDGYGNFLRPGKYPTGILSLELPAEDIDINVHPQKSEVRFRRTEVVYSLILRAIDRGLKRTIFPAQIASIAGDRKEEIGVLQDLVAERKDIYQSSLPKPNISWEYNSPQQVEIEPQNNKQVDLTFDFLPKDTLLRMRFVGQIYSCYLILEGENNVAFVDMHAAHERVMFYKLKSQFYGGGLHSQLLLLPETLELPPEMGENFENFKEPLSKLGFEADRISETSIALRALPLLISGSSIRKIFAELFSLPIWSDWTNFIEKHLDTIIARLACHSAVRSGQELKAEEVYSLLDSLQSAENSGFCPHGRPIVKFIKKSDIEVLFGRRE